MKPVPFVFNGREVMVDGAIAPLIDAIASSSLPTINVIRYEFDPKGKKQARIHFFIDRGSEPWVAKWIRKFTVPSDLRIGFRVKDVPGSNANECIVTVSSEHEDELEFALAILEVADDVRSWAPRGGFLDLFDQQPINPGPWVPPQRWPDQPLGGPVTLPHVTISGSSGNTSGPRRHRQDYTHFSFTSPA